MAFADGNTLSFSEAAAVDAGSYVSSVGGFTQRCFRQRITGHGDYRDAFLVFFRYDASGLNDEVVIEFGSEYNFSASPPTVASGVTPVNLFVPEQPTLGKTTGGSSGQSGDLYVSKTYVGSSGESVAGARRIITLAVGERATSPSPAANAGATGYNVYAGFADPFYRQNGSPIPIGTSWTEATTGIVTSGTSEPADATMAAYTATISGGNLSSPVVVSIGSHWWAARWRWQATQRPLVRNYSDLLTAKAIFPYDTALAYGVALPTVVTWAPMKNGGFHYDMAATAARPELSLETEWVSAWLATGDAGMETSWRAHAECPGTMSIWIRDIATGALVDVIAHPYVSFNDATHASYQIPRPPVPPAANYFELDGAHVGEASFVPWMLTDDPYFLENAQALALYGIFSSNLVALNQSPTIPGLAYVASGQTRGFAWNIRDICKQADFAPISPPSWILPRSVFTTSLSNTRGYAQKFLDSTTPFCSGIFHLITETGFASPFMISYLNIVLSQIMWTGRHSSWDAFVLYATTFRSALSDVDDAYGWDHRFPMPYNYPTYDARLGAGAGGVNGGYALAAGPDTPTSWAESMSYVPAIYATPPIASWTADTLYNYQKSYFPWIRAELAAMALAGITKAKTNHDWFKPHMEFYPVNLMGIGYAWAFPAS